MKAKQPKNLKEMESFRDYLQVQRRNSKNMIRSYTRYADQFLCIVNKQPENIHIKDIRQYQLKTNNKYSEKSLTLIYFAVDKYIEFLIEKNRNKHLIQPNGKIWKIDVKPVKSPRAEPLTKDEVRRIFRCAETTKTIEEWRRIRNIAILKTLYYAIPRISELINIDVEHVNLDNNTIKLFDVKNDEWRDIPINIHCINAIKEYLKVREPEHPEEKALFLNLYGRRIGETDIRKTISDSCIKAKITKKVYPHLWRHTGITHLAEAGWNSFQIRELSRHKTSEILDVYVNIADEQRIEIASSLSRGIEDDTPKKSEKSKKEIEQVETVNEPHESIDKSKQVDNKDMYIQFLEERLSRIEKKINGTTDYIQ